MSHATTDSQRQDGRQPRCALVAGSVCTCCNGIVPEPVRTIAESIAYYKAMPESVKRSMKRGYELLLDSGMKVEFDA